MPKKDRRGFLKLLGIGAGAAVAMVAARMAQTPAPAPRTIQDIEKVPPYIGPDEVPGGDYIKERPPVVPEPLKVPDLTPLRPFTFTGDTIPISKIEWNTWNTPVKLSVTKPLISEIVTTTGTYAHNLDGYPVTADDAFDGLVDYSLEECEDRYAKGQA